MEKKEEESSVIMVPISLGIIGVIDFAAVTRYRPGGGSFTDQEFDAETGTEEWRETGEKSQCFIHDPGIPYWDHYKKNL